MYQKKNIPFSIHQFNTHCPLSDEIQVNFSPYQFCPPTCFCKNYLKIICENNFVNVSNKFHAWNIVHLKNQKNLQETVNNILFGENFNTTELIIENSFFSSSEFMIKLKNIVKINFTLNNLKFLNKKYFFISKKLQIFILNRNKNLIVIEKYSNIFQNSLFNIQITFSNCTEISEQTFDNLENLYELNFSHSQIQKIHKNSFKNLNNLKKMDIRNISTKNKLTKYQFRNLVKIQQFFISAFPFCCYIPRKMNLEHCFPKSILQNNSCKDLLPSLILKSNFLKLIFH